MTGHDAPVRVWQKPAVIMLVCVLMVTVSSFAAAPDKDMAGVWRGEVDFPDGPTIEVDLEFYKSEEGEDCAFLIVPEDDSILNIKDLTMTADSLWFDYEDAGLTFKGSLERGKKIEGTITQGETPMPVTFVRDTD